MNTAKMIQTILIALLVGGGFLQAQQMVQHSMEMEDPVGEVFQLPELGGIIVGDKKGIKFMMVMGKDQRPKAYKAVDAKAKDEILMMNGKRIRTTAALKEMYDALAIGDAVKLGLRRDGQMFIADFPKIDPEKAPKMMIKLDMGDGGEMDEDIIPLPGYATLLIGRNGKVTVDKMMVKGMTPKPIDLKTDDQVTGINGKPVSNMDSFLKHYEPLKTGASVTLTVDRSGKSQKVTFTKPESNGKMMIKED